ncbi:MAG: alpha/beta fold hydrolase [Muribaculaceae bacterium]|nr:alpha/beta fold hydrolase [Muribaculaceae bacterium]
MNIKLYLLVLLYSLLGNVGPVAQASNLEGSWEGKLIIKPEMRLRLVINIAGSEGEETIITMDSPDQGAYGIPMNIEYVSSDSLNVTVPQLMLKYKGKLEGDSIKGDFSQGGLNLPLILRPKVTTLTRPQTPKAPFPYVTEEVVFQSSLDNADLYGTLCLPSNNINDTPVVLLVTGSGTQNRDEEIFEHKPFAVIADYLARNGIASLRYDDRGFDKSTGLSPNPTTYENSMDAVGGVNFLKEKGFSKVGIIGHSEGGLIADKVASIGSPVDFIVEIGGPVVPGDSILLFQNEFLLKDGGLPDNYISLYIEAMKGMFESQKDIDPVAFDETKYAIFSQENLSNPVLAPLAKNLRDNFSDLAPWLKYFINYNPIEDIKNISIPILMLYGEKDIQVPPALNVPLLLENFPDMNVKVYPDLNHLMQHSTSGKLTEYAEIEETISTEVLEDIKQFILSINK